MHPTAETKKFPQVFQALDFLAHSDYDMHDAYAIQVGWGISKLPAEPQCQHSTVIWWIGDGHQRRTAQYQGSSSIDVKQCIDDLWAQAKVIRYL